MIPAKKTSAPPNNKSSSQKQIQGTSQQSGSMRSNGNIRSTPKNGPQLQGMNNNPNETFDNYGPQPTNYSQGSSNMAGYSEDPLSNIGLPSTASESVRVALRIRPLNNMEVSRGDEYCIKYLDERSCQLFQK